MNDGKPAFPARLACALLMLLGAVTAPAARAQDEGPPPAHTVQLAQVSLARHGGAEPIAVLYPDIGDPFRKIFTEIVAGIEDKASQRIHAYPVGPATDAAALAAALKRSGARVVVALGRQGLKVAGELPYPTIVGAISSAPESDRKAGVLLTPDPALLFAQLKTLVPGARRVIVVYNPAVNEWLVRQARDAARLHGLDLQAYEARDLAGAARLYESAFAAADPRRDAIWLPPDATTVDEATILPLALREAWNRGVPLFSSSLLHVRKGVLFALYPDNTGLGHTLAALAESALGSEAPRRGLTPLRDVHNALNLRTASHLGLNPDSRLQHSFDYVFSEP